MHDDEVTSDELDDLIETVETLHAERAADGTDVRLYVAVDPATLHELGTDVSVAAAEALRAGAHAARRPAHRRHDS